MKNNITIYVKANVVNIGQQMRNPSVSCQVFIDHLFQEENYDLLRNKMKVKYVFPTFKKLAI